MKKLVSIIILCLGCLGILVEASLPMVNMAHCRGRKTMASRGRLY